MSALISLDYETHLIKQGLAAPPIVCVSTYDGSQAVLGTRLAGQIEQQTLDALESGYVVGQNIAYDFGCFLARYPEHFGLVWDRYANGRILDIGIIATLNAIAEGRLREGELYDRRGKPIGRYSLQTLVEEWLQRADAKENAEYRLRYAELDDVPVEQWPWTARQYPLDDARNTWEVAQRQFESNAGNLPNAPFQTHVAFCLHLGSVWGIRCDPKRVDEFEQEAIARQRELKEHFIAEGLYRYEGPKKDPKRKIVKTTAAVQRLVEQAYGNSAPRTESGAISTDRVTLEDSGDPLLVSLVELGKLDKQVSYLPALREASKVPLNVRPNVMLASGRSSYEGIVQLIPRKGKLRPCFKARDGYAFVSVDYNAIELSALAQRLLELGFDSKLAAAINAGQDPHCVLGSKLNGMSYEEFYRRKDESVIADLRQAGKAGNFGFPGMMGPVKFVIAKRKEGSAVCEWFFRDGQCGKEGKVTAWKGREIERPLCPRCIQQAAHLRQFYAYEAWTEMPLYWEHISSTLDESDQMVLPCNGLLRGGLHGPSAANFQFQGLAAQGAKLAVVELTREMYLDTASPLYGSRLVIFAHDETIIEAPLEKLHEAAHRQAQVMVEQMKRVIPDVRVAAEPAAMLNWYKEAKPVYVGGKLVPWEPRA